MRLVLDTNILFSFFRENPVRKILIEANQLGLILYAPAYAIEELRKNKQDLLKYTGLKSNDEIELIMQTLQAIIEIKPGDFFEEYKEKAQTITPDLKDAPFFALALKLEADIWSNEPRLNKQSAVKVMTTQEVRKFIDV